MSNLFSQVLNMSMTGSVVILLVMLARLILKRAPKIYSYALWSVVLFRLLCPVAFTAPVSVLDVVEPEMKETSDNTSIVSYIPATVNTQADFIMVQPEVQQVQAEPVAEPEEQLLMTPMHAVALVWATGMAGMMLYSVMQYLALRRRLVGSVQLKGNIYLADQIDTAFVVGLVRPKIYLPSGVPEKERYYILAHEQHHIRRGDHIIKLLAYLALCIHWFNPLVWLSFVLAGKDMEMSCDEAVIKRLGPDIRADYSASLLRLATHRKILSGMPLAFGEGDTKGRVLNMAKWNKPTKWVVAICVILCLCIVVVCAFNPEEEIPIEELTRHTSDGPVDTAIGDLCFIYPGGLTSEQRDVDNWSNEDTTRSRRDLPTRRPYSHFFIDSGVDFGGVVDFIVPEDREIRLEEMNLPTEWVGLDYIGGSSSYPYAEMEYTLNKDGKDYIQMYQYTYSGRGYFLWFYTEQGNPAHKEAILNSVELGSFSSTATKLKRDEIISLGQFNITVPKGYGYHRSEDKILEITRKERFGEQFVVGCVTARSNPKLPLETDADWVQWVEAVGLDLHQDDPNYGYTITDSGEYGDISLTLEEMSDKKLLMSERHYFYIAGDIVYHLWFDAMEMNWADDKQMLESIWIKEGYMPTVSSNDIKTDSQLIQYGSLHFSIPDGMEAADENGSIALTFDGRNIGGIKLRHPEQSNSPDSFSQAWQAAMGVPEASNPAMAYMGGGSLYADYEITYSPDVPLNYDDNGSIIRDEIGIYALDNEVTHYFFVDGNDIYDLWIYENRLPNIPKENLMKSCYIEGITDLAAMEAARTEEEEALAKCRNVIDAMKVNSYKIVSRQRHGRNDNATRHEWVYSRNGADWLSITNVLRMGADFNSVTPYSTTKSTLCANGQRFSYTGAEWVEIADNDSIRMPWLADFTWDEGIISYQGLIEDNGTECIMLRVDGQYIESDEYDPHYFVNFYFDEDDNFVNAKIQINLFRENEIEVTESIISLDPYIAAAEINQEYVSATGNHLSVPAPSLNSSDTALERCKSELEHIQSCSQALVCKRDDGRDNGIIEYWKHENDWMTIQRHSGDNMIAYLCKNGSYFDNGEMHGNKIGARDDDGNVLWKAGTKPQSFHIPWLSRYQWNDKNVHYLGTEQGNGEISIHLRISEPFPWFEWGNPDYSVTMVFDESHLFLRAELSVNQGHVSESGFTEVETVSSLKSVDVAERIDQEYQRAIG